MVLMSKFSAGRAGRRSGVLSIGCSGVPERDLGLIVAVER